MKEPMVGNKTMNRPGTRVRAAWRAIRLSMVSLAVLTSASADQALPSDHLIHWYKFNERSGSIAFDHRTTGAVNGLLSLTVARVNGLLDAGAVMLNGQLGSDISFDGGVGQFGTSDFTVAFWFETSETQQYFDLVGNRTAGSCGNFFQIRMSGNSVPTARDGGTTISNGVITAEIAQDGSCTNFIGLQSGPGFNDGQRHHLAVARAGSTMMLYVDGVRVASGSAAGVANVTNGNPFKIGRSLADCCFGTTFTPAATFDDLRIYNSALTDIQIRTLFNYGALQ